MVANRHGRYHCQQPLENKLTFFFFSTPISLPPPLKAMGSFFLKMMCRFIGADVSCQSNIRGTGGIDGEDDEEILMHIYHLIKGQSQQTSFVLSQPSPLCLLLSLEPRLTPLKFLFLFSCKKLLCFLVFHGLYTCLQPYGSTQRWSQIYSLTGKWRKEAGTEYCDHEVEEKLITLSIAFYVFTFYSWSLEPSLFLGAKLWIRHTLFLSTAGSMLPET